MLLFQNSIILESQQPKTVAHFKPSAESGSFVIQINPVASASTPIVFFIRKQRFPYVSL